MSAYHHIHLTTKITISVSKDDIKNNDYLSVLPKEFRDSFDYVYHEDFIQESPKFSDGSSLKWEKIFIVFALKKEFLKNVKDFISDSLAIAKRILYKDDNVYSEELDNFMEKFKELDICIDTLYYVNRDRYEEFSNELKSIKNNYFTNYTEVPSYAVYNGLPPCFEDKKYSFVGFDIVYSSSKLGEDPADNIKFNELKEGLSKLEKYKPLNDFIYHLEY